MVFSSLTFLFAFLPITLILYYLVPKKAKNVVILVSGLLFYAWGEPIYVLVMILSTFIDYTAGRIIDKYDDRPKIRTVCLLVSLIMNIGLLGTFKYLGFIIESLNAWFGLAIPNPNLPLPIGISFFTFQSMSYTIDLYRRNIKVQKNAASFMAFVTLFPQIVAGPIVRYEDIQNEIDERTITEKMVGDGISRFIVGLGKKVLIANNIGLLWTEVKALDYGSLSAVTAWLGILAFTFQIYFDFSGYSDMAIGLGKMMGFTFPENFNYPYISASITEFWRRWHMTLSGWFREYVYIPLGGNRKGLKRQIFNLFVVELLTGIWHGANWNFICWGLYYFVLLALEKLFLLPYLKKGRVWPHIYTLFLVVVGWAMFVGNDAGVEFGLLFRKLFIPSGGVMPLYFLRNYGVLLAVSVVCCTPLIEKLWKLLSRNAITKALTILVLLTVSMAYVVGSTNSPFLYFNF